MRPPEEIAFVLELGRALHRYGAPAHRLEDAMSQVSARLGLHGEFFSTPTSLMAMFGRPENHHTSMMRVEPGEMNLEKLALLDELVDDVVSERLSSRAGLRRVREIAESPPRYGALTLLAAYGTASGAVARFFGGGLADIGVGAAIGLAIGGLALALTRNTAGTRVFELVAAFVAAMMAAIAAALGTGASSSIVTLAGLIVLVPGLTLTVAMSELATRNLVSGTTRLMAAIIVFLEMALGVALAERAVTAWLDSPAVATAALPWWTELIALAVASLALVALFQAQPRSAPVIVAACFLGFWGSRFGAWVLGPELGVWLGAFAVGVACNIYARALERPATVPLVPAILLLVPGSLGFRGVTSLFNHETLHGIEAIFSMFAVAAAIVTGLLVANAAVSPRRAL